MKSLYTSAVVLAAVALIGSVGGASLQQASAIIVDWKEKFNELTTNFETAVSDAAQKNNSDEIKTLLDDYYKNVRMIFELEPTTEGDPPGEVNPPDPDVEPPEPDKS